METASIGLSPACEPGDVEATGHRDSVFQPDGGEGHNRTAVLDCHAYKTLRGVNTMPQRELQDINEQHTECWGIMLRSDCDRGAVRPGNEFVLVRKKSKECHMVEISATNLEEPTNP